MSQKIKAPNSKGGNGFLWVIVAILAILFLPVPAILLDIDLPDIDGVGERFGKTVILCLYLSETQSLHM